MENENKALKSEMALHRCAKAAFLLYALKSHPNTHRNCTTNDGDEEMWKTEIRELKIELVKERLKTKKIKLCSLLEFFVQLMLLLSLLTFFTLFVLKTR